MSDTAKSSKFGSKGPAIIAFKTAGFAKIASEVSWLCLATENSIASLALATADIGDCYFVPKRCMAKFPLSLSRVEANLRSVSLILDSYHCYMGMHTTTAELTVAQESTIYEANSNCVDG